MNAVLNIAHRGASSLAPENTLLAAAKALEIGAGMWELDVGVTVDGALIVIHDDTLSRTTNAQALFPERAPWHIYDFTQAEIKRLRAGIFYLEKDPYGQIAAGNVSAQEQADISKASIPTLEEALQFTRSHNWQVNVEIKTLPAHIEAVPVVEQIMGLIEAMDMGQQVLISSFAHGYLQQIKARWPHIKTGALVTTLPADPVQLLTQLQADALHPWQRGITPLQISTICQAGFEVNVFTVNDVTTMEQLIEAGVSGIFTDFPQRLLPLQTSSDRIP